MRAKCGHMSLGNSYIFTGEEMTPGVKWQIPIQEVIDLELSSDLCSLGPVCMELARQDTKPGCPFTGCFCRLCGEILKQWVPSSVLLKNGSPGHGMMVY